jgi:hypothetical protein
MESGAVRISIADLKAMLDLYEITDARKVAELDSMARAAKAPRAAKQRPWWRQYREPGSQRFLQYVQLEQAAEAASHFQPQIVPGLLQTSDYASTVIRRLDRDVTEETANRRLELRMERQKKLLDRPEPPRLSFVLDESVLYWRVGSAEAMEAQIRHLIEMAGRPHITIHIRRFSAGPAPTTQAPFVIIQFPGQADPDALFLESHSGDTLVVSDQDKVGRYRRDFEELQRASLTGPESVKFLEGLVHDRRLGLALSGLCAPSPVQ